MDRTLRARPLTATLAFVGLLLVLVLLGLSFASVRRLEVAHDRSDRTSEVKARLGDTLQLLLDAETGQRGFLLTGQPKYLEPFELARREIPPTLARLDALLDDDAQKTRLAELEGLVNTKMSELEKTVDLQKTGKHDRAIAEVEAGNGRRTMQTVRSVAASMQSAEEDLLSQRNANARRFAHLSLGVIAVASGLLLLIAFLMRVVGRALAEAEIAKVRAADLENFAGRVAHDVRSPLASVGLAVGVAQRHTVEPRVQTALERATRTLQRVATLVDGLLVFAKSGARPAEGAEADVRAIVADVVEATRGAAEEKGVLVEGEDLAPTTVACSPGVLTSMVTNLVDNAVKYMGDASVKRVSVRARRAGTMTRIEVLDTGPGVPAEMRVTIFDPYVRAPGSDAPGLGLGLATVRRLAEAHGGAAGVTDNEPAGSVFWFDLPDASERQPQRGSTIDRIRSWVRDHRAHPRSESHG